MSTVKESACTRKKNKSVTCYGRKTLTKEQEWLMCLNSVGVWLLTVLSPNGGQV